MEKGRLDEERKDAAERAPNLLPQATDPTAATDTPPFGDSVDGGLPGEGGIFREAGRGRWRRVRRWGVGDSDPQGRTMEGVRMPDLKDRDKHEEAIALLLRTAWRPHVGPLDTLDQHTLAADTRAALEPALTAVALSAAYGIEGEPTLAHSVGQTGPSGPRAGRRACRRYDSHNDSTPSHDGAGRSILGR